MKNTLRNKNFTIDLSKVNKEKEDIILCINKESDQPEIFKFKDRFLHTIVIGSTGSGKIEGTFIPMIAQDIQNKDCGITVIEPIGELANKCIEIAKEYNRDYIYFNPTLDNCPYFNPLIGKEEDVVENIVTVFSILNPDSSQFFKDNNEILLRNSLKVLKRLRGDETNFIELACLINMRDYGIKLINEFEKLTAINEDIMSENKDIAAYFRNDYFAEKSKTFEFTSAIRTQISKINSNKYLRKVLNPKRAEDSINFAKHLESNKLLVIVTEQGKLHGISDYLSQFIMTNFQLATTSREGNENTRKPHYLYIDNLHNYINRDFINILTQGRSYKVACHLGVQSISEVGFKLGMDKNFLIEDCLRTNIRNVIIYPGVNVADAKYYSQTFGLDFSPEKMTYLPFGEITYRIIKDNSIHIPKIGYVSYFE